MPLEIIDEIRPRKEERSWLRTAWLIVCGLCGLALFMVALKAHADPAVSFTWPQTSNKVTLHMTPCELGPWFKPWKRAVYLWNGEAVEACWKAQRTPEGDLVFTVDSQGDIGQIPVGAFTKDEGA